MTTINMEKIISVLIPIYNAEKDIERCLNSIFSQTIANSCEYILVNDYTPDQSMHIAQNVINNYQHLKNKIRIINHDKNKGCAEARNTLLRAATGKYIQFIDSDDWCELDMLETLLNKAEETGSDIVSCDIIDVYNNKRIYHREYPGKNSEEAVHRLMDNSFMSGLVIKLIRRDLYVNNNIYLIPGVNHGEDFIFSIKLYYYAKLIDYVPSAKYYYNRTNINSLSHGITEKSICDWINKIKETESFLDDKSNKDDYAFSLINSKVLVKYNILINLQYKKQIQYRELYNDITDRILSTNNLPFICKLYVYYFTKKYVFLSLLLNKVIKLILSTKHLLRNLTLKLRLK